MDLSARLREIVRSGPSKPASRELTYEPDFGSYRAIDIARVGELLGGAAVTTPFGPCLVIDRRYESERWHGDIQIGDCELRPGEGLALLDPGLALREERQDALARAVFIDLETTGLSGGAGTVAFLVGLGSFDLGAFQVRQFLLTSHAAERALLSAVSECFGDVDLIVTYNGKTFDVPVMETRWVFHRMERPLDGIPHFDMLHPARRLWKSRTGAPATRTLRGGVGTGVPATRTLRGGVGTPIEEDEDEGGCRLATLERALFDVRRVGDVPGLEIPGRFFRFLRSGDPRPLEPVLEHNRLDLVSLAAVTARAVRLAQDGPDACRDCPEALALGRVYERAGDMTRAERCYRRATRSDSVAIRAEALYRLGLRCRRERRFDEAAPIWRELIALEVPRISAAAGVLETLKQFAVEALAIHHEHRARDYDTARELAMFALDEASAAAGRRSEGMRHRLARLERKIARDRDGRLFSNE